MNCDNCCHALMVDEGYSNYTVEGTMFYCMLKEHPQGNFDRWYGEDKRLNYANFCAEFKEGGAQKLDVDREDLGELSDEAKAFVEAERI